MCVASHSMTSILSSRRDLPLMMSVSALKVYFYRLIVACLFWTDGFSESNKSKYIGIDRLF